VTRLSLSDLADGPIRVELGEGGEPVAPLVFLDLSGVGPDMDAAFVRRVRDNAWRSDAVLVGRCQGPLSPACAPLLEPLACTIATGDGTRMGVEVSSLDAASDLITTTVRQSPRAALALVSLLRMTADLPVEDALVAESLTYSMLLAGVEFARWRQTQPERADPAPTRPTVLLTREHNTLYAELNRPERRNAFGRWVRDGLVEALDLALTDDTINNVVISGRGPDFCSGGDLAEFGSTPDVATAHLIRMTRSVGLRLHQLSTRTQVIVHGACVGAGIELPAFASDVTARPDACFWLPELSMGLIPGAGGTVSIPRRIGRWRATWLALSGSRIDTTTALAWGLVDRVLHE
jgi:hypothetical protein